MSSVWRHPWAWKGCVGAWCPSRDRFRGSSQLTDHSGAHNNGTLTNMDPATDWILSPGASGGYALDFDGSNDYVGAAHPMPFGIAGASESVTLAYWVKKRASNKIATVSIGEQSLGRRFHLNWYSDGNVYNTVESTASTGYGYVALSHSAEWYHLCLVYHGAGATNADKCKSYVNGAQQSLSFGGTIPALAITSAAVAIGLSSASEYTDGQLDDIRIYSRVLTPSEIQKLYTLGRGGAYRRAQKRIGKAGAAPPASTRRQLLLTGVGR